MSRRSAYKRLSEAMGIPAAKTHIGWFDVPACKRVVDICAGWKGERVVPVPRYDHLGGIVNQADEDALVESVLNEWRAMPVAMVHDAIRLAIREAVAQERERCAKVCEKNSEEAIAQQSGPTDDLTNIMLRHHASQAYSCAAAIRRGE